MEGLSLELQTRIFGTVHYEEEDVITFPQGIPSFEEERSFLILPIQGSSGEMFCLQSIATPALTFILVDPFFLLADYSPALRPSELKDLGVKKSEELCYYVLCAMKRPVSTSTVNLKCPIALNPALRRACQVILESDAYHMRHPLSEFSHSEEDAPC